MPAPGTMQRLILPALVGTLLLLAANAWYGMASDAFSLALALLAVGLCGLLSLSGSGRPVRPGKPGDAAGSTALADLHAWALRLRGGDLAARIEARGSAEFDELAVDLNFLGEMLQSLARETEQQLAEHTRHLNQKTQSLTVLYDVAASINMAHDLNDLLSRFLHTLTGIMGAQAAAVRLAVDEDSMRLVASIGLGAATIEARKVMPLDECLHGHAASGEFIVPGRDADSPAATDTVIVPLRYRERLVGLYEIQVAAGDLPRMREARDLFVGIGQHLGVAIEKARLDYEAQFLSIMQERSNFANELHDSLAQTILSIGYQLRVLDDTLAQNDEQATWRQVELIRRTLDDANREARNLISHFRSPLSRQGLIPSIEQAIERFRSDTGTQIFLQQEWPARELPPNHELQVLRIVQESLNNIRKHSGANTVRVLLSYDGGRHYRVLIEDDGVGIADDRLSQPHGDHFGLEILQDRAARLGGELAIESEPGEGTRVALAFDYAPADTDEQVHIDLRNSGYEVARAD